LNGRVADLLLHEAKLKLSCPSVPLDVTEEQKEINRVGALLKEKGFDYELAYGPQWDGRPVIRASSASNLLHEPPDPGARRAY